MIFFAKKKLTMIFRYGLKYNKTFALPKSGGLTFNYKQSFKKEWIKDLPDGSLPDILSQHIRYSPDVEELFPSDETFKFTIVRNPETLFPSLFKYFGRLNRPFREAGNIERFLNSPLKFL